MNYANELTLVNTKIAELTAQLTKLQKEQNILTQLVEMQQKMESLEKELKSEEKAPYTITDLKEEDYKYYNCVFACKVNDEADYNRSLAGREMTVELTQVRRVVELNGDLFSEFKNDTMGYFDYIQDFGGTVSTIDLEAKYPQYSEDQFEGIKFINLLNKDENVKRDWEKYRVEVGTMVVNRENGEFLIASQQGYSYARYIAFPHNITEATAPKAA